MNIFTLLFCVLLSAPLFAKDAANASAQLITGESLNSVLYGRWEGEMQNQYYEGLKQSKDGKNLIRIDVSESKVSFFHKNKEGEWVPNGAGFDNSFSYRTEKDTLVGSFVNSGIDEDGRWVESQTVYLTSKDKQTLLVYWMRAVNNTGVDKQGNPASKWALISMGELKKAN